MLVACKRCHRQYDVGGMQQGERVRCACSVLITVPHARSHTARVLHCSACGGKLNEGATACEYCGCAISLDERNLGAACPECFARLHKAAKHCRECGVKIQPEKILAKRLSSHCPRCKGDLVECTTPQGQYTECSGCGGMWLAESFFEKVVEEKDSSPLGKTISRDTGATEVEVQTHAVKYLPCPVCGNFMNRKNFASCSGVIIDWCKGHGFWFDTHELEKIIDFVKSGGMDQAREKEIRRAQQEVTRAENRKKTVKSMIPRTRFNAPVYSNADVPLDDALAFVGSAVRKLFGF